MKSYIIILPILVLAFACKKKEPKMTQVDPPDMEDSTFAKKYDIKDFDLELIQASRIVPGKMIKLQDGSLLAIANNKDLSTRIIKTTDPYGNWTTVYNKTNKVFDIAVDTDGKVYAVSQEGFMVSNNNGSSWTSKTFTGITWGTDLQTASTMNLSVNQGHILLARNWGNYTSNDVFLSTDGGVNFTKSYSSLKNDANKVLVIAPNVYYNLTYFSAIQRSINGSSWNTVYTGIKTGSLYYDRQSDILFSNYNDQSRKSTNKGLSWASLPGKTIPSFKMSNGDYLGTISAQGLFRSNDGGTSWLTLGNIKNSLDGLVEYKDKLVASDGSGTYILQYGKTYWDYIPKNEPVNYFYNQGAKNIYAFNGQLFTRADEKSPWRFTLSFDNTRKIVYYTKSYRNRIFVVTQNTFGSNSILHEINSAGTYIIKSTNVPWTGGVTHFTANASHIMCIFKGNANDRDYIAFRKYIGETWTVRNLPPNVYHKIHFIDLAFSAAITIGFEAKSNNFQQVSSITTKRFVESVDEPQIINNVDQGWPGLHIYDHIGRYITTGAYSLAFLEDDMFIGVGTLKKSWTKSLRYTNMDANKKNILRYSAFTQWGYPINSIGQYSKPVQIEEIK